MTTTTRQPRKALPGVINKARWLPPLMCIFGVPGIGKSTFAAGAPNPIFVTTENGVDNLDVARFPKATTLAAFMNNMRMVANEEHDHGAVVIDTLGGMLELYRQANLNNKDFDFVGFGGHSGWTGVVSQMKAELMPLLFKCKERGMFVILLAHAGDYTRKNPLGADLVVAAPAISKFVWKELIGDLEVIGRADFVYTTQAIGKATGKAKASTDVEVVDGVKVKMRQLNFESGAEQDCKARVGYELPPTMPLSWEAFASHLGNVRALAAEIRELWRLMPEQHQAATLNWLGIDGLERLDAVGRSKLSQLRNRLLEMKAAADAARASEAGEAGEQE